MEIEVAEMTKHKNYFILARSMWHKRQNPTNYLFNFKKKQKQKIYKFEA